MMPHFSRSDLRHLWHDLACGHLGDISFVLDDGSHLGMHQYVMAILTPEMLLFSYGLGSIVSGATIIRLRYVRRDNFLMLRRLIYYGRLTVVGSRLFSLVADGMMLKVFNRRMMEQALRVFRSYSQFFVLYRNVQHDPLVIEYSNFRNVGPDIRSEQLVPGGATQEAARMRGTVPDQAVVPDTLEIEADLDSEMADFSSVTDSPQYEDDSAMDTDATSPVTDDPDGSDEEASSSSSGEYHTARSSPIEFEHQMQQYLEELIDQTPSNESTSSTSSSENVITAKINVRAFPDAKIDTDESDDEQSTEAEYLTEDSDDLCDTPPGGKRLKLMDDHTEHVVPLGTAAAIGEADLTPDPKQDCKGQDNLGYQSSNAGGSQNLYDQTDGSSSAARSLTDRLVEAVRSHNPGDQGNPGNNGNVQEQHAAQDVMYARRSLPLPLIQEPLPDIAEELDWDEDL